MKIKLDEDILTSFKDIIDTDCGIEILIRRRIEHERNLWETLKKKFKEHDFTGAKIDHITGELVLPFCDKNEPLA